MPRPWCVASSLKRIDDLPLEQDEPDDILQSKFPLESTLIWFISGAIMFQHLWFRRSQIGDILYDLPLSDWLSAWSATNQKTSRFLSHDSFREIGLQFAKGCDCLQSFCPRASHRTSWSCWLHVLLRTNQPTSQPPKLCTAPKTSFLHRSLLSQLYHELLGCLPCHLNIYFVDFWCNRRQRAF